MADVAVLEVLVKSGKARAGARAARSEIAGIGATATTAQRAVTASTARMGTAFSRLRAQVFSVQGLLLSFGVGLGLGQSIRTLRDFEFSMSRVQAITQATGVTFYALQRTARDLGATTVFTASEAADGLRLLSQAGFTANEAMAAIPGTLDLAVAGALDLASAASITADAIRGFNLEASEATRVADVLAVAATNSNTNVFELGEALKFVAPIAASAGQDIESVAAAIGVLSDAGLKGTLAGTGLRRVIIGLTSVTPKGEKALARMGLTTEQLNPELNDLSTILRRLQGAALDNATAFELFGLRGGPAALVLANNADRFERLEAKVRDAEGAARRMADVMQNNLRGATLQLTSALQEATLQLGDAGLLGGLRDAIDTATGVVRAFSGTLDPLDANFDRYVKIAEAIREVGRALGLLVGAKLLGKLVVLLAGAGGGLVTFGRALGTAAATIGGFLRVAGTATSVFGGFRIASLGVTTALTGLRVAMAATPWGLLINGAFLAAAAYSFFKDRGEEVDGVLEQFSGRVERNTALLNKLRDAGLEGAASARPLLEKELDVLIRQGNAITARIRDIQSAIASGEGTPELRAQLAKLQEAATMTGDALRRTGKVIGEVDAIAKDAAAENDLAQIFGSEGVEAAGEALAQAAQEAAEKASNALSRIRFEIDQVRLGEGAQADLERFVREGLRTAGVLEVVPEDLQQQLDAANEKRLAFEEKLAAARAAGNQQEAERARKLLQSTDILLSGLQFQVDKRKELRGEIEQELRLLFKLKEQEDARAELAKEADKATEDRIKRTDELLKSNQTGTEKLLALERELDDLIQRGFLTREEGLIILAREEAALERIRASQERQAEQAQEFLRRDALSPFTRGLEDANAQIGFTDQSIQRLTSETVRGLGSELVSAFTEGANAGDALLGVLDSLGKKILELAVQEFVIKPITGQLAKLGGGQSPGEQGAAQDRQRQLAIEDAVRTLNETQLMREQEDNRRHGELLSALGEVRSTQATTASVQVEATKTQTGGFLQGLRGLGSTIGGLFSSFSGGGKGAGIAGAVIGGIGSLAGSIGGLFTPSAAARLGGPTNTLAPSVRVPTAAFKGARRFQFGGAVDNIPALLSRDEAVVPLPRGRGIPVDLRGDSAGGVTIVNNFDIRTPDASSFRENEDEILSAAYARSRRAAQRNG